MMWGDTEGWNLPADSIKDNMTITGITYGRNAAADANTMNLMFRPRINKIRSQLNFWKLNRNSLLGRVLIAKTMGLSQIQHIMNCMVIPNEIIKEVTKVIYNYIWDGPDKITRQAASRTIEKGGINMTIPDEIQKACLIGWIKSALDYPEELWAKYIIGDLNTIGGLTGLMLKRIPKDYEAMDPFNAEIIKAWQDIYDIPITRIMNQTVFGNWNWAPDGQQGELILDAELCKYNITRYSDFFNEAGHLMSGRAMANRGLPQNLVQNYIDIKRKISQWIGRRGRPNPGTAPRVVLKRYKADSTIVHDDLTIDISVIDRRRVLEQLQDDRQEIRTPGFSADKERYHLTADEIITMRESIRAVSIETKMRSFMIRKQNDILYGNKDLKRFGHTRSNKCTYCLERRQTYAHLIENCPGIRDFISEIKRCTNTNPRDWIAHGANIPKTYIIMSACRYIYHCNLNRTLPIMAMFKGYIKSFETTEFNIASRKNKLQFHYAKWNEINTYINMLNN